MSTYKLGSSGEVVATIQAQLAADGFYRGALDGVFGGATDAAVRAFQRESGLGADGIVGAETWGLLFGSEDPFPAPALPAAPLDKRCLALTGSFETNRGPPACFAGLSGDFDGQGLSFGACQWNFGQGSLQPLLLRMIEAHQDRARDVFHDHLDELAVVLRGPEDHAVSFARSIQDPNHRIDEPWHGMFEALGATDEFEQIEVDAAGALLTAARNLSGEYGLFSERALALMFDIKVQNGSISPQVKSRIFADFAALPPNQSAADLEVAKMRIVAARRAEVAKAEWVSDVRTRKLCIANGTGRVHGIDYDLERDFGIGLRGFDAPAV